jgi:hypothetical protein
MSDACNANSEILSRIRQAQAIRCMLNDLTDRSAQGFGVALA